MELIKRLKKKGNPFGDVQYERHPGGAFIIDGIEVGHTVQCCHCNGHFLSMRGSGARRGFCMRCMKTTCGKKTCDSCIPFEKKLELYEKGKVLTL